MKARFLFVLGLLCLVAASGGSAPAEPLFPSKLPHRIFRPLAPQTIASASAPRLRSNVSVEPRLSGDQGNVSIVADDGTMIIPQNAFDLATASLVFTPQGSGYTVQSVTPTFVSAGNNAQVQQLGGNSIAINLPFTFTFYGKSYKTLYLNSNGNLTFGTYDNTDFAFGLREVLNGPPRIAALFDYLVDAYGGGNGQIGVETFSDHVNFYWYGVEDYNSTVNTFEIILQNNGIIRFNYNGVNAPNATVALSPGGGGSVRAVDFSQQSSPLSFTGTVGEVFSPALDLDLTAVAQTFYQSHPDNYDGLMVFSDVDGMNTPYAQPVRNGTQGIGLQVFDYGSLFGSKSRLFIMGNMGSAGQYPA